MKLAREIYLGTELILEGDRQAMERSHGLLVRLEIFIQRLRLCQSLLREENSKLQFSLMCPMSENRIPTCQTRRANPLMDNGCPLLESQGDIDRLQFSRRHFLDQIHCRRIGDFQILLGENATLGRDIQEQGPSWKA